MKEKNLPDDINSKSLDELTQEANNIIEQLEKKDDLKTSLDQYQELMRLNNIIEKKFQKKSKYINQSTREKINSLSRKKDEE
ncbi:MAG: exonuclease VII small subunit [Pelagibacterales bacterium]|jgi:Na+/phosphate symporter|uniref:Exonuclease VII small subunit n=1 Tax=marine metagenome TaxID=408172 RepID=A0A382AYM3_9ZZZZ|nr:exonuclease VII small subunit [Pelagibacterales bacterium]|tara:strand:+ start:167 stop:412 length:246 start_codon:yes stop_codon:yes gene_type:complete